MTLVYLEELLTSSHSGLVQLSESLYLRSDYVRHLVLVLPDNHPKVPCVAQSSKRQVELLLAEPTWEKEKRCMQSRVEIASQCLLQLLVIFVLFQDIHRLQKPVNILEKHE